jgi:hypothetical protein
MISAPKLKGRPRKRKKIMRPGSPGSESGSSESSVSTSISTSASTSASAKVNKFQISDFRFEIFFFVYEEEVKVSLVFKLLEINWILLSSIHKGKKTKNV